MKYRKTMSEALAEIREGFSKKEIKMAIGVASDPRYKQGNYTGAVNAIEKIKKGLSKHPQVAAVLKRQNEKLDQEDEPFVKDLIKNLRKGSATHSKQADDLEKAVKEETELDEMKEPFVVVDTADGDKVVGMASSEKGAKEIITTAQLPPMKIKDKKTLKIVKVKKKQMIGHPIKEETELDEDKSSAVYDFDRLIKDGGIDKRDFRKAKNLYVSGKLMDLRKHIYNLDTSPLEAIMDVIAKNDPKAFMKMYPKSKEGEYMSSIAHAHKEEVELDESKMKDLSMKIDSITAKMKKDKQMKSFADKFKKDAMKSMDIKKSLEKVLPDYIAGKDIQALVKEAFVTLFTTELDEAKEVLSRFKDDKLKKSIMNLATQKGLKVKEMGDKLEVSGNARKVMDLTLAVQKHDVKIEHNMMSAYTAAITKGVK